MKLGLFLFAGYFSILVQAQEPVTPASPVPASPVAQAPAQAPAQTPPSEIEKFSYIPPLGTALLDAGFTYESLKGTIKAPAGTVTTSKITETSFNYIFHYGVSDYLALGLDGSVLMTSKTDTEYGPGSTLNGTATSLKRAGWVEPAIGSSESSRTIQAKPRIPL